MYSVIGQLLQIKNSVVDRRLTESERQLLAPAVPTQGAHTAVDLDRLVLLSQSRGLADIKAGSWLVIVAFLFGVLALVGLMQTAASDPINLLYLLLVFGPLQWLLMALGTLTLLRGSTPLLEPLLSKGLGKLQVPKRLAAVLFFHLNQSLSLMFLLSALGTFVCLLAFRDLSFGWQTTFQWTPEAVARMLQSLAFPWSGFWAEAFPSQDLILQTRFVRLSSQNIGPVAAMAYGQWWPFIVAFIVTYSLLPRLLLWLVAHWLLKKHLYQWVGNDPVLQATLSGLQNSGSDLVISDQPSINGKATVSLAPLVTTAIEALPEAEVTWYWKVPLPAAHGHRIMQLGLPGQWQQDERQIAEMAQTHTWNIVVPGWEAPTAELADLMSTAQSKHDIHLILKSLNRPLSRGQQSSWEQFVREKLPQVQLSVWTGVQ